MAGWPNQKFVGPSVTGDLQRSQGAPWALFPVAGAGHGAWGADTGHGLTSCRGPACSNLLDLESEEDRVTFQFVVQQLKLQLQ